MSSKTHVKQAPLSIGLFYGYSITSFCDLFFKLGPNWRYTKTYLDLIDIKHKVTKKAIGATLGLESVFQLKYGLTMQLFINYLYDKITIFESQGFDSFNVYLGGLQLGAGIGYSF